MDERYKNAAYAYRRAMIILGVCAFSGLIAEQIASPLVLSLAAVVPVVLLVVVLWIQRPVNILLAGILTIVASTFAASFVFRFLAEPAIQFITAAMFIIALLVITSLSFFIPPRSR
jgi:predicted RND superfamily exporter protein